MIYEPAISPGTIHGANLRFIEGNIPHIWKLLTDLPTLVQNSGVVVLLKKIGDAERCALQSLRPDQTCIDFVGALGAEDLDASTVVFGVPQTERAEAAANVG